MKPLAGLFRDTWWLWAGFLLVGTLMAIFVHPIFLVVYPISFVSFFYFALVRYDENGEVRNLDE